MQTTHESIQLLNTAVIKSKEKLIDASYEERLSTICQTPAVGALSTAVTHLSEKLNVSRDQAAIQIIEAVRELDSIWDDYIKMEGISKLKGLLREHPTNF
ncbi:MAG: hypothetical protein ISR65_02360 [Bacteriovoracaceae bacterium]|nr:hypothetical protein [Bacteriovoracaceae bacterium]